MCDALKCCTNPKKLKLCYIGISVEDCQRVADVFHGLTGLQKLSLHCSDFSEGIMSLLSGLQNISGLQLELTFEGLGQGNGQEISRELQLISGTCLDVVVSRSALTLEDAVALTEMLYRHLKILNSLRVENNVISTLGASVVASALQTPKYSKSSEH